MISSDEADALAARLLGDLRTKLGGSHIAHARRVAAAVAGSDDERVVAVALLHDVLEKTEITADELRTFTRDSTVVALVELLTQVEGESDHAYLSRCAADPTAVLVKRLDLEDKLVADASGVPESAAETIRRQAMERLELLEQLTRPS